MIGRRPGYGQEGVALIAALGFMALIGAVLTGALVASHAYRDRVQEAARYQQAAALADAGLMYAAGQLASGWGDLHSEQISLADNCFALSIVSEETNAIELVSTGILSDGHYMREQVRLRARFERTTEGQVLLTSREALDRW
jgi:hypothetical protein